jgi:hypothetical protein
VQFRLQKSSKDKVLNSKISNVKDKFKARALLLGKVGLQRSRVFMSVASWQGKQRQLLDSEATRC